MTKWLHFLWSATRGSRLRPWRSPYLRWRVETYTGKRSSEITAGDMLRLAWGERGQMLRFAAWLAEMRTYLRDLDRPARRKL